MGHYLDRDLIPMIDISSKKLIEEISNVRKKGNFQTVKNTIGKEKLVNLINKFYPKYDIKTLEKIFKVPNSTLSFWFKNLGIETVRRHINNISVAANFNHSGIFTSNNCASKLSAVKITPALAYLIGFTLGDGSVQKYQIEVFNQDKGMYDYLVKIMEKLGPVTLDQREDGLWRIRLSSRKISDLIKRNKIMRKETINFILNNDNLAKHFLAALWDAEGSVLKQKNYFHVYFYNSNKDLIDMVSNYLDKKDIGHSVLKLNEKRKEYFVKGRLVRPKKQICRIGIPKSDLKKWVDEIGLYLLHSKKKKIVSEIIEGA